MEKLNKVARYGVDGYGRQDIYRDDESGEFVYYEDFKEMQQRAEAAEAKLAELEKQKPYGYVHNLVNPPGSGVAASIFKEESRHYGRPVFTRPAPAINLAELVPEQVSIRQAIAALENHEYCTTPASGYKAGVKDTIAAILRNIEEAK